MKFLGQVLDQTVSLIEKDFKGIWNHGYEQIDMEFFSLVSQKITKLL